MIAPIVLSPKLATWMYKYPPARQGHQLHFNVDCWLQGSLASLSEVSSDSLTCIELSPTSTSMYFDIPTVVLVRGIWYSGPFTGDGIPLRPVAELAFLRTKPQRLGPIWLIDRF